jgi:hypothetical protein
MWHEICILKKRKGGRRMKNSRILKWSKALCLTLALLMTFMALSPLHSDAGVCETALARCAVDAVIVGLFSGVAPGLIFAAGCGMGYQWCLMYY